ncbi:MAG: TerD family protein, partial [Clostridia bacterium]|nr:TerD family protein [Clostridia bacterium]
LLRLVITEYGLAPAAIACRDTAVRLLGDLGDVSFADFLNLSDVIKLADYLNTKKDARADVYHLALSSADRRLITQVLDRIIAADRCDVKTCYERKKAFCGLLHHIHYKPKCERGEAFCAAMRGRKNHSVTSAFERAMSAGQVTEAARILTEGKGGGALLRNLNYVLSRCTSEEEISAVLTTLPKADPMIYIQLLLQYETASNEGRRSFTFTRHNRLVTHRETEEEATARRSRIPHALAKTVARLLRLQLELLLGGRLGRVYIDPACDRFAVPVSEASTNGGYGVLAKGSRLPIPEGKKLRAFTYWERVNDIDLSAFILNEDGSEEEFSWRTIGRRSRKNATAVTFSGDETSGYHGGSEYFDIDLDAVRALYPKGRYIIFCNNVYSNTPFASCVCRAGYMLRDNADSGEIFEPKTVRSAFTINCRSTEAYLFGIDLLSREMVWINAAVDGDRTVAGVTTHEPLERYFRATEILSLGALYRLLATEVVATPEEADVLVLPEPPEGTPPAELVLPHDFPRILSHLAPRK